MTAMDARRAWEVFRHRIHLAAIDMMVAPLPPEPMTTEEAIEFDFTPEQVELYNLEQSLRDLDAERKDVEEVWDAWLFLFDAAGARLPSPERVTEGEEPQWRTT